MFLNGGSYGDAPVLHPHTVAEMTRDQIPGIGVTFSIGPYGRHFEQASLGLRVGRRRRPEMAAVAGLPARTFSQRWRWRAALVDPSNEIVGVYLSVCRFSRETHGAITNSDLFVNAVVAAVR